MANNRLYLINRRLGVKVYLARFGAGSDRWDVRHGFERELQGLFDEDLDCNWQEPDWELCHEGNLPNDVVHPEHRGQESEGAD
jgi:hypothetical protein